VDHLREYLDQQRDDGPYPAVVLGDFNDAIDDPPAWNVFGPLLDPDADTTFVTQEAADDDVWTLIPFRATIDHILLTNDTFDVISSESTEVLRLDQQMHDYTELVSDHRPVLTSLGIQQAF
jgi:endonuclease/exonuclease/phosphatase family metal-dependent hydrolase